MSESCYHKLDFIVMQYYMYMYVPAGVSASKQTGMEAKPESSSLSAASTGIWAPGLLQDKVAIVTGTQVVCAFPVLASVCFRIRAQDRRYCHAATLSDKCLALCFEGTCWHVTGGGAGIGLACVKALAQVGSIVVAVDVDKQALK